MDKFNWLLCGVQEYMKPVIRSENEKEKSSCCAVLYTALEVGLRLIHPFMPYISEELYQRLPATATARSASIMISPYPEPQQVCKVNQTLVRV